MAKKGKAPPRKTSKMSNEEKLANSFEPTNVFGSTKEMQAAHQLIIQNGLAEAVGVSIGSGSQLSQVDTLFKNNRWYLISNLRQLLSEIYVEHGLVQTIVDVPVDDGLRGGLIINSKELDEDDVEELLISIDRDGDLLEFAQAAKWNRLFGGAGVMVITDQDASTELNVEAIRNNSPLKFRAVDMWELFYDKQNVESQEYDPSIQIGAFSHYNYYGKKVHKSRVFVMKGLQAPSFIRPRLRGWGFSVVETLVRSINQYLKANDLGFEVLDEFKLDIYKIKNLANTLMQAGGTEKIRNRIALANSTKNYQNAIVMDSEDDYDHKQLTWSGLADAMAGIRMQIASDMRMPLTKVFGISSAGFSSGEDDIENYNAMVESQVRGKIKYDVLRMVEMKCQKLFGFVPTDLSIDFHPLRVLSAEQEENVKTQKFNRAMQTFQAGLMSVEEFKQAVNRDNLLPIQLDPSEDQLNIDGETEDGTADAAKDVTPIGEEDMSKLKPKEAPKVKNSISRVEEPLAPLKVTNSLQYDVAAYKVDGGDGQFGAHHERSIRQARVRGTLNEELYKQAVAKSKQAFGAEKWQFTLWLYKKNGGKI